MIASIASLAGLFVLAFAPAPAPDPYGICEGIGSQLVGAPPKFDCVNHNCDPGCVKSATMTPFGAGQVCLCDYIGPHPDCCALVFVPGAGGFTKQGDCNAPGCNTGGACTQLVLPGNPGAVPPIPTTTFVNCPIGGIGLPPDDDEDGDGDGDGDGNGG